MSLEYTNRDSKVGILSAPKPRVWINKGENMFIKKVISSIMLLLPSITYLEGNMYQVAFYSDFEPISYSESRDPANPKFNQPNGYEVDLLKAIEAIPGSDMTFQFHGIKEWNGIWLYPYTHPEIDIAIGGITREDRRLLNGEGKQVVANTHKTTHFMQSLLMNAIEAALIKKHQDLTCGYIVGAVRGTTGEYRYLAQTGIIKDLKDGFIKKGFTIVLEDKTLINSDGLLSIYDTKLANRSMLVPPECTMPITKYFIAEDTMIPALQEGYIDAIARGFIGNSLVADRSNGKFVVTAIFSLDCPNQEVGCAQAEEAVFFVKADNKPLVEKLNQYIDYLTDNGKIEYEAWKLDKNIFRDRAQKYPIIPSSS